MIRGIELTESGSRLTAPSSSQSSDLNRRDPLIRLSRVAVPLPPVSNRRWTTVLSPRFLPRPWFSGRTVRSHMPSITPPNMQENMIVLTSTGITCNHYHLRSSQVVSRGKLRAFLKLISPDRNYRIRGMNIEVPSIIANRNSTSDAVNEIRRTGRADHVLLRAILGGPFMMAMVTKMRSWPQLRKPQTHE